MKLVIDQMVEVQAKHPALKLTKETDGQLRVSGELGFSIQFDGRTVTDTYQISLHIPDDYPESPPSVFETEGKVPKEFQHFMKAGNLCLDVPVEVNRRFAVHRNLFVFIDEQVIPYLFANSYKRENGELPFGERQHGHFPELFNFYMDYFGVGIDGSLKLLRCLGEKLVKPNGLCPCGSDRGLKYCHGPKLDELRSLLPPEHYERELRGIITEARQRGLNLPEHELFPDGIREQDSIRPDVEVKAQPRRWKR